MESPSFDILDSPIGDIKCGLSLFEHNPCSTFIEGDLRSRKHFLLQPRFYVRVHLIDFGAQIVSNWGIPPFVIEVQSTVAITQVQLLVSDYHACLKRHLKCLVSYII